MSGAVLFNQRGSRENLALDRSAEQLAQDLNRALSLAIRTRSYSCSSGSLTGYGIFANQANPSEYYLYADCDGDQKYKSANDDIIETRFLETRIVITRTQPGPASGPNTGTSITYEPPDPTVFFRQKLGMGFGTSGRITLATASDLTVTKIVVINIRGRVTIE